MKTELRRTCPSCGNEFSGAMEFCPVCTLRKALDSGFESGEPSPEDAVKPALEMLLEKNPGRCFQNPAELLKAIPTITGAIDARRRITRQSLQKTPSTTSRAVTRKPLARLAPKKISLARLPVTGSDLFGREEDIAFLDDAWANQHVNVVTIVAWAGVGKSTLVNH